MIGHKNVIGIITMSLLVFIIAACNPSSQDVYEELSKTEINDNGPVSTIERNDSDEVVKDANMIMTIGNTKVDVSWEDNDSVRELKELAAKNLSIQMSMY